MFFFAIAHGYAFPPTEFAVHNHNPRSKAAELSTAWDEQWENRSSSRSSHFEGAEEAPSGRSGMRAMLPDFHLSEFAEGINLRDIWDMRREVMVRARAPGVWRALAYELTLCNFVAAAFGVVLQRLGKGGRARRSPISGARGAPAVYSTALVDTSGNGNASGDVAVL